MPSPNDIILIGILLLALVTVESGGYFLTRVVRGHVPANRLIVLLWIGVVSLTAALITAGIGLIAGGVAAL